MVDTITFVGMLQGNRIIQGHTTVETITLVGIFQGNRIIPG